MHIWGPSWPQYWSIHQTFICCPLNSMSVCLSLCSSCPSFRIGVHCFFSIALMQPLRGHWLLSCGPQLWGLSSFSGDLCAHVFQYTLDSGTFKYYSASCKDVTSDLYCYFSNKGGFKVVLLYSSIMAWTNSVFDLSSSADTRRETV